MGYVLLLIGAILHLLILFYIIFIYLAAWYMQPWIPIVSAMPSLLSVLAFIAANIGVTKPEKLLDPNHQR